MSLNPFSTYGRLAYPMPTITGKTFVVSNDAAILGRLRNVFRPDEEAQARVYETIDAAIGQCVANRGDRILVAPGHAETLAAAGDITLDVAGVDIIGLGSGADRPTLTFGNATTASMVISADSCSVKNFIGVAGIDGLTKPFDVTGNDATLDIEWRDASSTVEAATVVRLDTADNAKLNLTYRGFTAGNAAVRVVAVDDCDNVDINIDAYGVVSTAWVNLVDAASTNVKVRGRLYTQGVTNFSRLVVDTIGGSTWDAEIFDASFGGKVSGGSAAALASDDVAAVASEIAAIRSELSGAAGITTFPTAAPAANGVSLAEMMRYVQDLASFGLDRNNSRYLSVTADFTSATWNTVAAHEIATVTGAVRMVIVAEVAGTITSAGSAATLVLGDETTTNSLITSTDAENLAAGEIWCDATDTRTLAIRSNFEKLDFVVAGGKDIGYTIGTEALTGGSIVFHIWWAPVGATGNVAAGAGGAL